jgi:hypothetical protein
MKKKDSAGLGMTIPKRMRIAGMTFYLRNGQVVGRESSTHEKRSNTLPQFIQRQKMRHTTALWKMLRFCNVMFTERRTAYQNFASLANVRHKPSSRAAHCTSNIPPRKLWREPQIVTVD